jgi:dolichyl-diphosphooligosaccharide---protein glycosyltransferase
LNSQTKLFQTGSFNFKLNHLVIIGVLILAFSASFLIRSMPAEYGFELNEFDPFFNFRATEYLVENGLSKYLEWNDDRSWYPLGRDVSATSQVMLHVTAAITYQIFAGNSSLYDFTILFPAIIGSLTVIVIFALVRLFAGTTAGLIASLLFAISLPILIRGSIGWFKSEPLGIFYGLLGLYLFLSAIHSKNNKIIILKIIFGGIIMGFGMSAWGGIQFFVIPLGLFILALPFFRNDHKFLLWCVPLFTVIFLLVSSSFERPGPNFVYGMGGLALIIPNIFLVVSIFVQKISKNETKIRNNLFLLLSILLIGSLLLIINDVSDSSLPGVRYLHAVNPFLTTNVPLIDSVAEHSTSTTSTSFLLHSILMIFAALGAWFLLSKKLPESKIFIKNDMRVFVIIIGITGVYVSSSFVRLELFASISLIILASISLSILSKKFFMINTTTKKSILFKISFIVLILILFIIPMIYPSHLNWIKANDYPVALLTGGTGNPPTNDWKDALEWIKTNTPENSVIASWWDWGYWIQTLGERATLSDNSTIHSNLIKDHARMLLSTPDSSWKMLQEMNADYIVTFISVQKVDAQWNNDPMYLLGGGGDELKIFWFANIGELPVSKYLEFSDNAVMTNYFWNETLLGKMIPYTVVTYYDNQNKKESNSFLPGYLALSIKEIKYDHDGDGPLKLVYASPSFYDEYDGMKNCVFIYEINKNYVSFNNP